MIRFENVRKEYDDLLAVADLNLEIPEGEIYGLIGPNGAGKTTSIRIACGLLPPTSGRVFVNGIEVHREPERAQEFIGYLADFFSVYDNLKVYEYLSYFAGAYQLSADEIAPRVTGVIDEVGLTSKKDSLIKGLSRGMKQRLGIARAIIHRPRVLLLDEPASGLDPKARIELRNLLVRLRQQGATILVSSHILTELEGLCTMIGIMERGALIRSGQIGNIAGENLVQQRKVDLRWLGSGEKLAEVLKSNPGISDIRLERGRGQFQFSGPEDELAPLLGSLISAGIPVIGFAEVKQTVEQIYMTISHHEVM